MPANPRISIVSDARPLARIAVLTQAGLALSMVFALTGFSLQFPNPNELKWEFVALCDAWIMLEVAVAIWSDGVRVALDRLDLASLALLAYVAPSVSWSADAGSGKIAAIKWLLLAVPFLYLKHFATPWLLSLLTRSVALVNAVVIAVVITAWATREGLATKISSPNSS